MACVAVRMHPQGCELYSLNTNPIEASGWLEVGRALSHVNYVHTLGYPQKSAEALRLFL